MNTEVFNNRSFTILGAGRSGIAIAKFLSQKGYNVFLSDSKPIQKLPYVNESVLLKEKIKFEFGGHSDEIYKQDVIIKSPGLKPNTPVLEKAVELGKKILGEVEIAYRFCPCPVLAITGTNGKTTTTILIGKILKDAGFDARVCGNVGRAFADELESLTSDSLVVLEVSSYQLEDTETFKPTIAVFMNFTSDHIEWHGSLENYFNAKMKIALNQNESDTFIFNADDAQIVEAVKSVSSKKAMFSLSKINTDKENYLSSFYYNEKLFIQNKNELIELISRDEIKLKGLHNVQNYLAAGLAAYLLGVSPELIRKSMSEFTGVEHRIEFCGCINGVEFYNDSKATNLDSMLMALKSFEKVVLIAGGQSSEADLNLVKNEIKERVITLISIGEMKDELKKITDDKIGYKEAMSLDEAIIIALSEADKETPVLFSPGFKSFDMFNDYEHRGNEFKLAVNKLSNELNRE